MLFDMWEKEQSTMVWKTTNGFHVPQQGYPHFVTSVLKIFMRLIFVVVGQQRNIFDDENFPIYGSKYTSIVAAVKSETAASTTPPWFTKFW